MSKVRVLVLRVAGTNCDMETAYAFERAGAKAEQVHINRILDGTRRLSEYHILAVPGGFSYGDDIAAGTVLANQLSIQLGEEIRSFLQEGKLVIGICNGFQALVKAGFLPAGLNRKPGQATLAFNDSGKFEDRWVYLEVEKTNCVFLEGIEKLYLPVAHAEGKFMVPKAEMLEELNRKGQIALRYVNERGEEDGYPWNPNGSMGNVAGICDDTGRIFGLMPHPERHVEQFHHPRWTRMKLSEEGEGLRIFKNAARFAETL